MLFRVVITGLGFISVLGQNKLEVAKRLHAMDSGIVYDKSRLDHGFSSPLTGAISYFDPSLYLTRKQRRSMPDFVLWAYAATEKALNDADLEPKDLQNERTGLIYGNDSSIKASFEQVQAFYTAGDTQALGSGHLFRSMNSNLTMQLNVILGTLGPSYTVSAACASGAHALGLAFDNIRLGRQDLVLTGAAQEISMEAVSAFDGLGAFSKNPIPEQASRPFDAKRDGLVPSGGAVCLILEELNHAKARGATIYGEILGYGASSDGYALAKPSKTGLSIAMRQALYDARLNAAEITLISAHATSTILGDAAEAANLKTFFGENCPPIMALKSLTGHELWMSGASQVAYTALMAQYGFTSGTKNFEEADDDIRPLRIFRQTYDYPPSRVLFNAAGFGGTNVCLVAKFTK